MQALKGIPRLLGPGLCVLVYGYSAVDTTAGRVFSVQVDLSRPESIVWPCEIAVVGDMGERGLRIGPRVGAGWKGQAGGRATYRFYVPQDGNYCLWAYARWFDKCTNAMFARVDNQDRALIGNDPVYRKWHWVRGFSLWLPQGPHILELSNHSDDVSLQKILLVNSSVVLPEDCPIIFSDVFYDGFDGCHVGNFSSWDIRGGRWTVEKPPPADAYVDNALVGRSTDSALVLYEAKDWSDYLLHAAFKPMISEDSRATAALLFGLQAPDRFYQLRWRPTNEAGGALVQLCRQADGETEVLAAAHVVCAPDAWHDVEIVLRGRTIEVGLDGAGIIERAAEQNISGGIGFLLEGQATVYFDDVHVRTMAERTGRGPEDR
jgi:hypothetical protein